MNGSARTMVAKMVLKTSPDYLGALRLELALETGTRQQATKAGTGTQAGVDIRPAESTALAAATS